MKQTEFEKCFQRPCQYCGECPVWLAAFEKWSDIQTEEDLHNACRAMVHHGDCDCYGAYVGYDELGDNHTMKSKYVHLLIDQFLEEATDAR